MNLRRSTSWIVGVLVACANCGGAPAPAPEQPQVARAAPATADEPEDQPAADLAEHHRHHHHGGFAMFIAMSLDTLGVAPDQRAAVMRIQTEMHAKMMPAHDAEKTVLLALADGVAAGQVDRTRVDAAIAEVATASAGMHDAVADSLNELHQVLHPAQRHALMDKLESHLQVWEQVNAPPPMEMRGHQLEPLQHDLDLSADQVNKILVDYSNLLGSSPRYDRAEASTYFDAFAKAFLADNFDAHAIVAPNPNAHMATWGITRTARLYEAAASVLTPEQRVKAADALRHHASYKRTDSET